MLRIALLLSLVLLPSAASAQMLGTDPLSLTLSPASPKPYETVTLTAYSTLVDLAASEITFYVDGREVEKGPRSTQVRVGGPGTRMTVRVIASAPSRTVEDQITIAPADVALVVEPAGTSHPLYDGAQLIPAEGQLRIVALADLRTAPGTRIPDSQVAYTWKSGNQVLQKESGLGKNVLIATAPSRYRDAVITVTATNQAKTISAQSSITVTPADPVVRIYKSDPLTGVHFEDALDGTFTLGGTEETFRMVPFFFRQLPSVEWTLNGVRSGIAQGLTVRSGSGSGTALLGVRASAPGAEATSNVSLRFSGSRGTGIFGL